MIAISANNAKQHFGEMLDTVQREPVSIKKHGRPVAVVISQTEYEQIKLERLRAKIAAGAEQAKNGEFADYSLEKLKAKLDEQIKR
jgi:prevent-host-death family protein